MTGRRRRNIGLGSPDQELIQQLLAGDAKAEEEFLSRFRGLAIGLARGRFGLDPLIANEVWQEVVLKLWADDHKALRSWRGEGRFSTYLTVIVVHVCLRLETKRTRRAHAHGPLEDAAEVADGAPDPRDQATFQERQRVLKAAICELSPRDRLLLNLQFADDHSPTEIARLLGQSAGATRKALFDARKRLRRRLVASHPDFFSDSIGNDTPSGRSHSSGDSE